MYVCMYVWLHVYTDKLIRTKSTVCMCAQLHVHTCKLIRTKSTIIQGPEAGWFEPVYVSVCARTASSRSPSVAITLSRWNRIVGDVCDMYVSIYCWCASLIIYTVQYARVSMCVGVGFGGKKGRGGSSVWYTWHSHKSSLWHAHAHRPTHAHKQTQPHTKTGQLGW